MKKILGLTIAALLVMGLVGGGTWAYFSDPEASTGNVLGAGTLDLNWAGGNDAGTKVVNLGSRVPGDSGNATQALYNAGTLLGELDIAFSAIVNSAGGLGTEYEGGLGELGASANMSLFLDMDDSDNWNSGDIGLKSDNTTYNHPTALLYAPIDSYSNDAWNAAANMTAGLTSNFYLLYDISTAIGNAIQGDNCTFNITFTLEQTTAD